MEPENDPKLRIYRIVTELEKNKSERERLMLRRDDVIAAIYADKELTARQIATVLGITPQQVYNIVRAQARMASFAKTLEEHYLAKAIENYTPTLISEDTPPQ